MSKPLCNELQAQNTMAQLQAVAAVFQDTNEIRLEDPLDQTPKVETSKVQPARHEIERNCHVEKFTAAHPTTPASSLFSLKQKLLTPSEN